MSRNVFVICELYYALTFYTPYSRDHQIEQVVLVTAEGGRESLGHRGGKGTEQNLNLGLATLPHLQACTQTSQL